VRDADFADLYDPRGRHARSPALLALVTVFQFLEGVPDRAALGRAGTGWDGTGRAGTGRDGTYALHLPVTYAGFD